MSHLLFLAVLASAAIVWGVARLFGSKVSLETIFKAIAAGVVMLPVAVMSFNAALIRRSDMRSPVLGLAGCRRLAIATASASALRACSTVARRVSSSTPAFLSFSSKAFGRLKDLD
jgi:hypothetical protein